jgi:hypothetical protein
VTRSAVSAPNTGDESARWPAQILQNRVLRASYFRRDVGEWLIRGPKAFLPSHPVQKWLSDDIDERSEPTRPVFLKRSWFVTGHTADNEWPTVREEVANADVNAWEDVFLVNVDTRRNIFGNVFRHHWVSRPKPLESKSPTELLTAFLLCQLNDIIEGLSYKSCEVFAIHVIERHDHLSNGQDVNALAFMY